MLTELKAPYNWGALAYTANTATTTLIMKQCTSN